MGMYDEITCDMPLVYKGIEYNKHTFQTKDMANMLLHYKISKNGILYELRTNYRSRTEEEKREYIQDYEESYGKPWSNLHFNFIPLKAEKQRKIRINLTGPIEFYDYNEQSAIPYYITFLANFEKGKVKTMKCHSFETYPERVKDIKKDKLKEEAKLTIHFKKIRKMDNLEAIKYAVDVFFIPIPKAKSLIEIIKNTLPKENYKLFNIIRNRFQTYK